MRSGGKSRAIRRSYIIIACKTFNFAQKEPLLKRRRPLLQAKKPQHPPGGRATSIVSQRPPKGREMVTVTPILTDGLSRSYWISKG